MPQSKMNRIAIRIGIGTIVVALCVLCLKYVAYRMTNSIGLYSDALESLVNLAASIAVLIAVWLSGQPADRNHPYGHHKAEYLSAVAEGVMIVIAAFEIFMEASHAFLTPRALDVPIGGLLLNGFAGVINAAWACVLIYYGRKITSPALKADGRHLFADVITSIGVLCGVGIAAWTGLNWLDPLLACLVGFSVLWTGWGLIRNSVAGLMDGAMEADQIETIRTLIMANSGNAIEAHYLRTRQSGRISFIEFHLVVPGEMSVVDAHHICDQMENALTDSIPGANITIHVEPENKALNELHEGSMVF